MNKKILDEIKKKVNIGDSIYYAQLNDEKDSSTPTDINDEIERSLQSKDKLVLLQAVYYGAKQYIITANTDKKTFNIADKNKTGTIKVDIKTHQVTIFDDLTKKKTIFELKGVTEKKTDTPLSYADTIIKAIKGKSEKDTTNIMKRILKNIR